MFYVEGRNFQPLRAGDDGYDESLIVYCRPERTAKHLVVLVHGLNGSRYSTWGSLPEFLFEDCITLDIGLYDYASGARRIRGVSTVIERHVEELADLVRDLHYEKVVLVGHSMGGLLCQGTIRSLIDSRTSDLDGDLAVRKIAGLFLMATPQAGSLRVPRAFRLFSKDARVLAPHSPFVTGVQRRFADVVQTNGDQPVSRNKNYIPTFALVATNDKWVDEFSSQLGLPRDHIKTVRGLHGSLAKPRGRNDDGYLWLLPRLRSVMKGSIRRDAGISHSAIGTHSARLIMEVPTDQVVDLLSDWAKKAATVAFERLPFETQIRVVPKASEGEEGQDG